ncbi:dTMP kinase [Halobacteriovorax sp. GB3]|uniref:dTMP kinase n=1 Tax=Halobacteriovorax sp. GB3 TaxID=2719615 RepID=UPI00235FFCF1|nr:dTMP kinase [Halobacteriovorax sp. GB3]MDD0852726.1 dTMP kinase [Halobacteriovorax sp. GB3]
MEEINKELLQQFRPPAFPGSFFISFEGIEGAGKTTQINRIKDYLEDKDFRVLVLREPGGTPYGEKLRKAILETSTNIHPVAESYLFASARAQLLTEVVLKELNTPNTIIICDRYLDSTIAYQGIARELGVQRILETHNVFPLHLVPHRTIYVKIDLETSLKRQEMRNNPKDYFESQDHSFHQKLIDGYDLASELFPERISVVDGKRDFDEVYLSIRQQIDDLIFKKED